MTLALTPDEQEIYIGSWNSWDDTGIEIFDAMTGSFLEAYSNPSTHFFYYIEMRDERALFIHDDGWF